MRLSQAAVLCRIEPHVHFFEKRESNLIGKVSDPPIEARNATSPSRSNLCGFGIRLV